MDISPGSATGETSTLASAPRTHTAAAWDSIGIVEIRDSCANLRHQGGDALAVFAEGPDDVRIDAPLTDHGNGTYEPLVFAMVSGTYTISAVVGLPRARAHFTLTSNSQTEIESTFREAHVVGSPWKVKILPGVISRHTTSVSGEELAAGVAAGNPVLLTLNTRDAAYNSLANLSSAEAARFSATLTLQKNAAQEEKVKANIIPLDGGTATEGQYAVNFILSAAGTHRLWVSLDGMLISRMPQEITCRPGRVSPSRSGVSGNLPRTTVAAEQSTPDHHFIVRARDSFGNAIATGGEAFRVQLRGARSVARVFALEHQGQCTHVSSYVKVV